jgi:hypothetical protein
VERTLAQGGLSGRSIVAGDLVFALAERADEADVRRLLRENELGGWVRLSLEREPDAFAAACGTRRDFIIARERGSGAAVGVCERTVRDAFVDGEVRRLPYLGSLRVAPPWRHRVRMLRGGFAAVRALLGEASDLPYALTAITADNAAAQRLLAAGLPGLPAYRAAGELVTYATRTRTRAWPRGVEPAKPEDLSAIAVLLQRCYRRHQFAPVWRAADLEQLIAHGGLRPEHILVVRHGPGVRGCLAVWDRSGTRQTVVRGYVGWLGRLRPALNLVAPLAGVPRLPPPGSPLRQAYLSHVAVEDDDPAVFRPLLAAGLTLAHRRGFDVALTGLAVGHPLVAALARERPLTYRSLLYTVHWTRAAVPTGQRMPHPEIALM